MAEQSAHTLARACAQAMFARDAASQGLAPIQVRTELGHSVPRGRSGKACRIVAC